MSSTNSDTPFSGGNGRALFGVPKLTGKANYLRWSMALKLYFKKTKSWPVVNGDTVRPFDSDEGVQEWVNHDDAAKYDIMATVNEEQQDVLFRLGDNASAHKFWTLLEKTNKPQGDIGHQVLLEQLHSARYIDGESMERHLARMRQLTIQLANIGHSVDDASFVVLVKASLPASWDTITFILDGSTQMDKDDIVARLVAEANRRELRRKETVNTSSQRRNPAALAVHNSKKATRRRDKTNDVCYNCGKKGHHSVECRSAPSSATVSARPSKTRVDTWSPSPAAYALGAQLVSSPRALAARLEDETWIIDSGAGCHFTGRKDALSDFVNNEHKVQIADSRVVVSPGHGSVTLKNGAGELVKLSKVMYLPGATTGLLSVTSLAKHGADVSFSSKDRAGAVSFMGKVILDTVAGTDYIVNARLVRPPPTVAASTRDTTSAPLMVWHRRYGHLAPSTIIELSSQELVKGLVLSDKKVDDCEACIVAKSKKSPFSATSSPADKPLQRVFIDLGFVDHDDHDGRHIYLAIVDQYTTAKWSFALSSKQADNVLKIIDEWRIGVENLSGTKVKRIRTDGGGEFVNTTLSTYLRMHGILHETTAPYTPEQNAQVERLNGSLMVLVKAMLHDANLPKSFWSLALEVATYVSNRTVHPRLHGKTAFELFMGKKPAVGHLRPFGSVAYAHVDKSQRSKLDVSAVKGIFVGYAGEYNYKIWLDDKEKVVTTRHATFGRREESELDTTVWLEPSTPSPLSPSIATDADENQPRHPSPPVDKAPDDGHQYVQYRTGRNPGRFEEIDEANILDGRRRTRGHLAGVERATIYARIAVVVDQEEPNDGQWDEEEIFVGVALPSVPRTYDEALSSAKARDWARAIQEEYDAFESHKVFLPARLPPGARALGTTWVFTLKTAADGSTRYKARLVAQGFAQRPGIDVNETFAPVVRSSTIRYLFALSAAKKLEIVHFDFNTAFLNGKMTEEVYIKVPPGYPGAVKDGQVLKLIGSMYGTKQAPREWHKALDSLMARMNYRRSDADVCVFTKVVDGSLVIIAIYVDDGLILASSKVLIERELAALHGVYSLKVLGPVSTFLSIQVEHLADGILIHHSKYVAAVLERFGFVLPSRARASTPMEDRPALDDSPPFDDPTLYQSAVGALMFTSTYVRADLAVAVRAAAQKVLAPSRQDWLAVKRIFLYLSNTVDLGIFYKYGANTRLVAYSDASWADDPLTRRSVGGYAILVAEGVVSWRSKQQTLVATSTTESELVAASDTTKEVLALRKLTVDLGEAPTGPTVIYEDNQAAIAIATNPTSHGRTKHFDVAQLFVRERVAAREVDLECISTNDMVADTLTKPLSRVKFEQHRASMGFKSFSACDRGSIGGGIVPSR
ncbi:hypothetical protein JCM3770_003611 [Rhodotorula araucariae]